MGLTMPNVFVIVLLTYYTMYIVFLINKTTRKGVIYRNENLNKLRLKKVKTLKEQKEFINLKYPKKGKFKMTWKGLRKFIFKIFLFVVGFRIYSFVLQHFGINFKLWQAILIIMTVPIIINIILEKFNLQKSDLRVFFK